MKTQIPKEPIPNALTRTIAEIQKGRYLIEADEALRKLVLACVNTGKKGRITLTLDVKPEAGIEATYAVTGAKSVKMPEPTKAPTRFYATEDGLLVRDNPNQPELFNEDSADVQDGGKTVTLTKAVNQ